MPQCNHQVQLFLDAIFYYESRQLSQHRAQLCINCTLFLKLYKHKTSSKIFTVINYIIYKIYYRKSLNYFVNFFHCEPKQSTTIDYNAAVCQYFRVNNFISRKARIKNGSLLTSKLHTKNTNFHRILSTLQSLKSIHSVPYFLLSTFSY